MSFPFTRLRARAYTSFPCHTAPADNASNGPSPQHAADVFRRLPDQNTLRVFNRTSCFGAFRFAVLPKEQKTRQQKLLSGTKSWTLRCHPALTRHRCRTHSSTANTVRLLTRALRPRLLVAFRLGPPGPILSGSVPAGITPPPTLSESVTRFLPVNGLLSCLNTITAFFCCQRIFCSSATFFIIEPFPALGAFFCIAKLPSVPVSGILHQRILVSPAAHRLVLPYENTPSLFILSFQAPVALSASPSFNMLPRGTRPRTFCTHRARITFKKIFGRHCRERPSAARLRQIRRSDNLCQSPKRLFFPYSAK